MVPELITKQSAFLVECRKRGLDVGVTSTDRRPIEQAALYVQGRYPLETVNRYRKEAGLVLLRLVSENIVVTKTLDSRHLYGEAFDIILGAKGRRHYNLKVDENACGGPDYAEAAEIGRGVGLVPGIDFGDAPHYQLPRRLT